MKKVLSRRSSGKKASALQPPGEIAWLYGDGAYDRWKVHHVLAYPSGHATSIESLIPPRRDAQILQAKRCYRHIEVRNQQVLDNERMGRKRRK